MQTPVEVFDEWLTTFPDYPQRFHPIPDDIAEPFRDQLDVFKSRMDALRKQFLPNRSIDVYLDFIDDGGCNAVASIYKYLGLIGLNKGLVLIPRDLFWRMFSHPGFLPDLGDCGQERRGAQHNDGIPSNYDALVEQRRKANRPIHARPPASSIRRRMAHVCADLVWRFTAMHELVHILHGHWDYLFTAHSLGFIVESMRPTAMPAMSRVALDRQAMEFSADAVAAGVVLRGFLTLSPLVGAYAGLSDVRQRLFLWSLSLCTLFRIWDFKIDTTTMHTDSHPPSAVRFAVLFAFVGYEAAVDSTGLTWDEYLHVVKSGQAAAEMGIAYCGGARLKQADLDPLRDPKVKAHRDAIFEHHDEVLYPQLEKRAYVAIRQTSDSRPT